MAASIIFFSIVPGGKYRSSFDLTDKEKALCNTWHLIYDSGKDRAPAKIPDSIRVTRKFYNDHSYIDKINHRTQSGKWELDTTQTFLILRYLSQADSNRKLTQTYKIRQLNDTSLILSFRASFGYAEKRYRKIK